VIDEHRNGARLKIQRDNLKRNEKAQKNQKKKEEKNALFPNLAIGVPSRNRHVIAAVETGTFGIHARQKLGIVCTKTRAVVFCNQLLRFQLRKRRHFVGRPISSAILKRFERRGGQENQSKNLFR
jgi:hypothetical protein